MLLIGIARAQPVFDNPSPTAGSGTSKQANEMADKGMYKPSNTRTRASQARPGRHPRRDQEQQRLVHQKFGPNNIADYAELELSKANFKILERADQGPLLNEFTLAYTMGDPDAARKILQKGKFKTTKFVVKFDILKAEPVAQASRASTAAPSVPHRHPGRQPGSSAAGVAVKR